jgi:DNA mismatch repair protein MutS
MTPGTPLFQQYTELKQGHADAILLFRLGDFYEMFFDDALIGARDLELTLTSRNKNAEDPVPMCGVPAHTAAGYIAKLVEHGHRVAIAEQVEEPTGKGLVKRAIVRVVSPGVPWDPSLLDAREPAWLLGICDANPGFGIALLDLSTGDLRVTTVPDAVAAVGEVHRVEPREVLVAPGLELPGLAEACKRHRIARPALDPEAWRPRVAADVVRVTTGAEAPPHPAVPAAGALLRYGRDAMGGEVRNVHRVDAYTATGHLVLDDACRRNLELVRTLLSASRAGSLLALLDQTGTAMGARMLREWLAWPLLDVRAIDARSTAVDALVADGTAREAVRIALREVADIERIAARVASGTASARELAALRRSLHAIPRALEPIAPLVPLIAFLPADVAEDVAADLDHWLVDDPPLTLDEGGAIRKGAHAELDAVTALALDGLGAIGALEERERSATGITSLKIRNNAVFGWFIEITRANVHRVPDRFVRKQTLSTGERFVTPELKELEEQVSGADERRVALERELFGALRDRVHAASARLLGLARKLAVLDVLAGLAEVSVQHRWVRATVDESLSLAIEGGRHPVVEAMLDGERFVPNDVELDVDDRRLIVLTGPNMAGKSTILRMTALVVLLAQLGSHVPATRARIGVCDRIYTRVGAVDDLARGQSTFMVEMAETAVILSGATRRSLVILDEIGRGTSTYDGLSIAWAVAEDLAARIRCRTLFATHYHELCDLAEAQPGVANQSIAVHESGDRIVFLRTLKDGGASRSYGIQCARLAGVPGPVLDRARELLRRFEKSAPKNARDQLSLFGALHPEPAPAAAPEDGLRVLLRATDPDALSPKQALEALYRLRELL